MMKEDHGRGICDVLWKIVRQPGSNCRDLSHSAPPLSLTVTLHGCQCGPCFFSSKVLCVAASDDKDTYNWSCVELLSKLF